MVESGSNCLIPEEQPGTRASALNIGNPPSWRKALKVTIEHCSGITVKVSDEEIMDAKAAVDRSGIGCEPASAASVAGLRKLIRQQTIDKDETAVCLLTGHILKDTDALHEYHYLGRFGAKAANPPVNENLSVESVFRQLVKGCF
jgi:threonine synthase